MCDREREGSMSLSSRQSLGGFALRDSSSRLNARSRRQSMGGGTVTKESPVQDRRALLDDWRRGKLDATGNSVKRDREEEQEVFTTAPVVNLEGSTALERYRMRKQQKLQQQNAIENSGSRPPLLPPARSLMSAYDDEETGDYSRMVTSTGVSSGTPSFTRRLTNSGKAARRKSYSVGAINRYSRETLSQESREPECEFC